MAERVKLIDGHRFLLPDDSERFLVNEKMLIARTNEFGSLIEPIKTYPKSALNDDLGFVEKLELICPRTNANVREQK